MTEKIDLAPLRGINLEFVLEQLGATRDPKDPKRNWRTSNGDRVTVTGDKFYNHDAAEGGGGAIDLAAHLLGYPKHDREGFVKAVSFLANKDLDGTVNQYIIEGRKHAEAIAKTEGKVKPENVVPPPNPQKLPRVVRYLTEHREIPKELVDKEIAVGRLYADNFGNAVFKLKNPDLTGREMGAELRGTLPDRPFHAVRGDEKGFYFSGNAKTRIAVFVESGVDALSYLALNPNRMAVASVGDRKETLQNCALNLQKQGFEIRSGFDLDKTGNRLENNLREVIGQNMVRETPEAAHLEKFEELSGKKGKDWNDALRGARAIEREAQQPRNQNISQEPVVEGKERER